VSELTFDVISTSGMTHIQLLYSVEG